MTKKIVIAGGGFAGVNAALSIQRKLPDQNFEIVLVSQRDYHLFTPSIYEIASSEEELVSATQTKKSVTLGFKEIFKNTKVNFLQRTIEQIDPQNKKIIFSEGELNYDYLVLALGSQSDFFGIKGADKFSLTLKSLPDALRIRNKIEFEIESHQMDVSKKVMRLVVAGGGYTGLEFAAELKNLADILALKYAYPRHKIEIEVIEANNKLVAGFDDRLSIDAYNRLAELGVHIRISARISEVDEHFVYLMSGDKVSYDCLVWTAGVKGVAINSGGKLAQDSRNRIAVNQFLQSQQYPEIFVIGDTALILSPEKKPVPQTAQDATHEAKYLAYALSYLLNNQQPPQPYLPKQHGFIVALGGKWGIMSYNGIYLTGFVAWFVDQLAHLRYYAGIVGWYKAVKYILFQMDMYSRND